MNESYDKETGEVYPTRDSEPRDAQLARLPPPSPPDFGGLDLLTVLEQRGKLMDRILDYAIKSTHEEQWFDLGGRPWPAGPACESMARRCGVSVTNVRRNKTRSVDDKGEFYIYAVDATASLPSGFDALEAFGTCTSRDVFLGTETTAGRPLSQVDEGSIMKAAYTNMLVNAVTRLLGVRSLSWERLKVLGINRDRLAKVEFEGGAKGGGKKAEGSDIVIKFGKGKDKTIGRQTDEDLTWYAQAFEKDLGDPSKEKYRKNAEKQLVAVRAEQARRANEKAGTTAKPPAGPTIWQRIHQLLLTAGFTEQPKQIDFVKSVTKKAKGADLVEADIASIQEALEIIKREKQNAGGW